MPLVQGSSEAAKDANISRLVHEGRPQPQAVAIAMDVARRTTRAKGGKALIRAYHGSPHKFEKFDSSKLGTGEGMQTYGHGLYFAESEPVARTYRTSLSPAKFRLDNKVVDQTPYKNWDYFLRMNGGDIGKLREQVKDTKNKALLDDLVKRGYRLIPGGHMYEVNIHRDPAQFMDWDKGVSGDVGERVASVAKAHGLPDPRTTGRSMQAFLYDLSHPKIAGSAAAASTALQQAGIPGIRYLDQNSRVAGQGTSNYVTFPGEDQNIEILRRYRQGGDVDDALDVASRVKRAEGGGLPKLDVRPPLARPRLHTGPIHSAVAGRTDHLPIHVPHGAYVLPADIVSGMGQGNTLAGFKIARQLPDIFHRSIYGQGTGLPYKGKAAAPYGHGLPGKAAGGGTGHGRRHPDPTLPDDSAGVPIVAAGGEHVYSPDEVRHIGGGDLDHGHDILDAFVKAYRAEHIKTLKGLPGPKRD